MAMIDIRRFVWKARRRAVTMATRGLYPEFDFGAGFRAEGMIPAIWVEGSLKIGTNLYLRAPTQKIEITTGPGAAIEIGDNVLINNGCSIRANRRISIGSHGKIGDATAIYDTNFHEVEQGAARFESEVEIGENVWIGRGCVILPGVRIGKNSVIGAGSIVTASIPKNVLAAGNPAKVIRPIKADDSYLRR